MDRATEKRLWWCLGVAAAGVGAVSGGLAWDSVLHTHDPGLAQRESLFTLHNSGHLTFAVGMFLVLAGVAAAVVTLGWTKRRLRLASVSLSAVLVLGSGAAALAAIASPQDAHLEPGHAGHRGSPSELGPDAWRLVEEVRKATAAYRDVSEAVADGYQPISEAVAEGKRVLHYSNVRAILDGRILDPDHPEGLVYATAADGTNVLMAAVFRTPPGVDPPNPGGVVWHTHAAGCAHHDETCNAPHILHVWLFRGVVNPFADNGLDAAGPAALPALERIFGGPSSPLRQIPGSGITRQ